MQRRLYWKIVITSEARDLLSATRGKQQIPRFARDDNLVIQAALPNGSFHPPRRACRSRLEAGG